MRREEYLPVGTRRTQVNFCLACYDAHGVIQMAELNKRSLLNGWHREDQYIFNSDTQYLRLVW